jgi:hypothetical protein
MAWQQAWRCWTGVKNVFIAVGVLIVFGLAAFLWAMGKGLMKKGK